MNLQTYGFVYSGKWEPTGTVNSGVTFTLKIHAQDRVIYSFVVDDEPKYIGICEKPTTSLYDRMKRYKYLQGAGTNTRIVEKIRQCLEQDKTIQIFALQPEPSLQFAGLEIDLVKGLENPLIEKLKPEWNR